MSQQLLAQAIIATRYPRPTNQQLEDYLDIYGAGRVSVGFLLNELVAWLDQPFVWEGYRLTQGLEDNRAFFDHKVRAAVEDFRAKGVYEKVDIRKFFLEHHLIVKYATQRWLLVNAGTAIEQFVLTQGKVEQRFLAALLERGLKLGDKVVHFHVVSNSERQDLAGLGFDVPHEHWNRRYYVEMLEAAHALLQSNSSAVGLFCEDSWVFDPAVHEVARDGRPVASFGFLGDDRLVGERFFVGEALPDNDYSKQYEFALRSPRRRALYEKGEFTPKTYGIFYPKELLRHNLPDIAREQ